MNVSFKNRGKRLFKGSVYRTLSTVLKIIIGFVMLPFLVHRLGDNVYGLWVLVMSFISYYTLLRMGLSGAVSRYLTQAVGKEDEHEMSVIASTSFFVYLSISVLMVLFTFAIIFGASSFASVKQHNTILFRNLILILGLNTALAPPFSVFGAILVSHLQYGVGEKIQIVYLLLLNATIILFVSLGKGVIFMALSYFIWNIVRSLFIYFYIKIHHREVTINFSLFDKKKFLTLFSFSFYTFISHLANRLRYKLDTVIITIFIGLSAITHYTVAASIITYFTLFIKRTIGVFSGYVSQEEGRGDYGSIREKFYFITKLNTYICVFVGGSVLIYGKAFIHKWMGIDYISSYNLLLVLTLPSIIYLSQYTSAAIMFGLSKIRFLAITNFIEGIFNVLLSIILVKKYGLVGVALGTAIPMFFMKMFIQPIYISKILKLNVRKYYFSFFKFLVFPAFILGLYFILIRTYISPSYLIILSLALIQTLIFSVVIYFLGFNRKNRQLLLSFIKKE